MKPNRIVIFGRLVPVVASGTAIATFYYGLSFTYYGLLYMGLAHKTLSRYFNLGALTFNDMLDHLLHGRFDVNPLIIGGEGFIRAGKTYSYFGIFPAFLRLPLIVLPGWQSINVILVSCILAAGLAAYFKLCAAVAAAQRLKATRLRDLMFLTLVVAMLFGGSQVQFAKVSIYVEVVFWVNALAAAFVYCAIEGLLSRFSLKRLMMMAVLAGLTLLTRVSTGMGLYAATGLLVPWLAWSEAADRQWLPVLFSRRVIIPMAILGIFALICGAVNFGRWGNPFTFSDLTANVIYHSDYPERLAVLDRYGALNVERIGYGLMYYFLPLWAIINGNHEFMFASFQRRTIDSVEIPPSSFFLTDPLLILLTATFLWLAMCGRLPDGLNRRSCGLLLAGLAVSWITILMFESMTLRYRVEFYPMLTAGAVLGFYATCARERWVPWRWLSITIVSAAALGVIVSHLVLVLYWLSPFGPADHLGVPQQGWTGYYESQIKLGLHKLQSY